MLTAGEQVLSVKYGAVRGLVVAEDVVKAGLLRDCP
jgi:hypothetical protein